jgi:hypothetical protein
MTLLDRAYTQDEKRARQSLAKWIEDPTFAHSLLLSSPSLFHNLSRYRSAVARDGLNSRDEYVERGVLRYFTRSSMKATPFAEFCTVIPVRFEKLAESELRGIEDGTCRIVGDFHTKVGVVRLNKALFGILWERMKLNPVIRDSLRIDVNPTIIRTSDSVRYLANAKGGEVFRQIKLNAAIEIVLSMFPSENTTFGRLVGALSNDSRVEATYGDACAYLERLTRDGLLTFRTGVRDQEIDWDKRVAEHLCTVVDNDASAVVGLLRDLRRNADSIAKASVSERAAMVSRSTDSVTATLACFGVKPEAFPGPVFYEDTTAPAEAVVYVGAQLERALRKLKELASHLLALFPPRSDQARMRRLFDARYGHRSAVPLLEFYEDFYLESRRREEDLPKRSASTPAVGCQNSFGSNPESSVMTDGAAATRDLTALVQRAWQSSPYAEEISLACKDVEAIMQPLSRPVDSSCSLAAFCQILPCGQGDPTPSRLVLHRSALLMGYGKFFSRFLHMLPEWVYAAVLDNNNTTNPDTLYAELAADAFFNANLHPPLMAQSIPYPTAESDGTPRQLLTSEIDVIRSPIDAAALLLIDRRTGTRIVPFDLGFQNPLRRPPLHRLLTSFSPPNSFRFPLPDSLFSPSMPAVSEPVVTYRPRVTYDGLIVLSRRQWSIPGTRFPLRDKKESKIAYFTRVNSWRDEYSIPEEVYATVREVPRSSAAGWTTLTRDPGASQRGEVEDNQDELPLSATRSLASGSADAVRRSRVLAKPQYIDFMNPLLVELFGRLPGDLERFSVVVEERMPGRAQLPSTGSERFASEFLLQFDLARGDDAGTRRGT